MDTGPTSNLSRDQRGDALLEEAPVVVSTKKVVPGNAPTFRTAADWGFDTIDLVPAPKHDGAIPARLIHHHVALASWPLAP